MMTNYARLNVERSRQLKVRQLTAEALTKRCWVKVISGNWQTILDPLLYPGQSQDATTRSYRIDRLHGYEATRTITHDDNTIDTGTLLCSVREDIITGIPSMLAHREFRGHPAAGVIKEAKV